MYNTEDYCFRDFAINGIFFKHKKEIEELRSRLGEFEEGIFEEMKHTDEFWKNYNRNKSYFTDIF